jgi:hypothetical protein
MISLDYSHSPPSRDLISWALGEWATLLREATASPHAERYKQATTMVASWLQSVKTMPKLIRTFFSPGPDLQSLVFTLCTEEDALLFPHVLMGASCALRLHQMLRQADTSDAV